MISENSQKKLELWADAVCSQNLDVLMSYYSEKALLKATLSNHIRKTKAEIQEYFSGGEIFQDKGFLNNGITQVDYSQLHSLQLADTELLCGVYTFHMPEKKVEAHFSFFLQPQEESAFILAQHSSLFV